MAKRSFLKKNSKWKEGTSSSKTAELVLEELIDKGEKDV